MAVSLTRENKLPVGPFVYRAIKNKNWVSKAQEAKDPAFRRRWQYEENGNVRDHWDADGLSFATTPEAACQGLQENFGVFKLSTERMRLRNFEFDEPDADGHVSVPNMPFYRPDQPTEFDLANKASFQMRECVVEFIPPINVDQPNEPE